MRFIVFTSIMFAGALAHAESPYSFAPEDYSTLMNYGSEVRIVTERCQRYEGAGHYSDKELTDETAQCLFEGFEHYANKGNFMAAMSLAKMHEKQGDMDEARRWYQSVIDHPSALPDLKRQAEEALMTLY